MHYVCVTAFTLKLWGLIRTHCSFMIEVGQTLWVSSPGPLCPPYVCSTSLFSVLHTDLFYLRTFARDSQCLEDFIFPSLPLGSVSVHAKLLQSCPTLCNPMDCSLPDSSVHGVLQARILEWVAMPSTRRSSPPRDQTHISYVSFTGRQILCH